MKARPLRNTIKAQFVDPIRYSQELKSDLPTLIEAVKAQGLEGRTCPDI